MFTPEKFYVHISSICDVNITVNVLVQTQDRGYSELPSA